MSLRRSMMKSVLLTALSGMGVATVVSALEPSAMAAAQCQLADASRHFKLTDGRVFVLTTVQGRSFNSFVFDQSGTVSATTPNTRYVTENGASILVGATRGNIVFGGAVQDNWDQSWSDAWSDSWSDAWAQEGGSIYYDQGEAISLGVISVYDGRRVQFTSNGRGEIRVYGENGQVLQDGTYALSGPNDVFEVRGGIVVQGSANLLCHAG